MGFLDKIKNTFDKKAFPIGYKVLEIEKKEGFPVDQSIQSKFGEWLLWSSTNLKLLENPSRELVKYFFSAIDAHFITCGYRFVSDSPLFYDSLQSKKINCNGYSTIYYSIGQLLNLPIKLVNAPSHVFCRWQFTDGTCLNWETTNGGRELRDDNYVNELHIHPKPIKDGIFLSNLSEIDIIANWHLLHGRYWNSKGNHNKALICYKEAIKLSPLMAEAYHNMATSLFVLGDKSKAFQIIDKAIELDPGNMLAIETRKIMAE
jgi:tetratricopeptide (TPR) repeat protein